MVTDVLSALKQIAFDHNTFDQFAEIRIVVAAVKYFAYDTNLFFELLSGVGMVYIYDGSWIFEIFFAIQVIKTHQIFIMIVRDGLTVFVDTTTENRMCKFVSAGFYITATVDEVMWVLCGNYRIKHNGQVTTCRILHADRNVHAACGQTVLLVFDGTCTDCFIGKHIIQIASVFRVKHFIC